MHIKRNGKQDISDVILKVKQGKSQQLAPIFMLPTIENKYS